METSVTFPRLPAIVPSARRFVRGGLADLPRAGDMELIASELVSNAIRHTPAGDPGGEFTVTVRTGPDWARIEVSDTGSGEWHPDPDSSSPDDEYGRGLAIIAASRQVRARGGCQRSDRLGRGLLDDGVTISEARSCSRQSLESAGSQRFGLWASPDIGRLTS